MNNVTIIIPCYNEEMTITKVVKDFQRELPNTQIIVYDNNSNDKTVELAKEAGATIKFCKKQGKGAVMRHAFQEEQSEILIIVDGDDTYPAEEIHALLKKIEEGADIVVGDRISNGNYHAENTRPLHTLGNYLVCTSINLLFKQNIKDVMSGYRAVTKKFYKNCPILLDGFEVETEMTIHAVEKLFHLEEIPVKYRNRPPGSFSKLNTFSDGMLVIRSIIWMFKDTKPLIFFSALTLLQLAASLFFDGKQSQTLILTSAITLFAGFILDTITKIQKENFQISLLKK